MKHATDRGYRAQLAGIRDSLLRMSGHVEEMLDDAMQSLLHLELSRASKVTLHDQTVDQLELEIDARCISVLARYHPVASDLRFVVLALKAVRELERIGDIAVNIAERVPQLSHPVPPWRWDRAHDMVIVTRRMLDETMQAMILQEPTLAEDVIRKDAVVNAAYDGLSTNILEAMHRDPAWMADGIHSLSIAKWLERAADHAANFAEYVVYMTRGTDIRHRHQTGSPSL